jgi:membrane protein DedA with SNARE-associated domain
MISLDDGEPATWRNLFFFWSVISCGALIWISGLIRIGYWLATLPTQMQSNADYLTGMLLGIGIGIGILIVLGLYRPAGRADRSSRATRTPE